MSRKKDRAAPQDGLHEEDRLVTAAELAVAHDIDRKARALAVQGLPAAGDTDPPLPERELMEDFGGRKKARDARRDEAEIGIRGDLAQVPAPDAEAASGRLKMQIVGLLMAVFQTLAGPIREAVQGFVQAQAEYNAFRNKNELLERSPSYPLSKLHHFAVVLLLVLIEGCINSAMYFGGNDHGIAGALLIAFGVSVVLVSVSVMMGLTFRYCILDNLRSDPGRRRRHQLWSVPVMVLGGAATVFVGLYAAHYRECSVTMESFTEADVLKHLIEHPFSLSLSSVLLYALNNIFCVLAGLKGFFSTDRAPGYERAHRAYLAKKEALDDLKGSIEGQLDAIRQTEIDGRVNQAVARRGMLEDLRKRQIGLTISARRAAMLDESDNEAHKTVVMRFRQVNLQVRSDGVVPACFAEPFEVSVSEGSGGSRSIDEVAKLIEAEVEARAQETRVVSDAVMRELARIERAKDRTESFMQAIANNKVDTGKTADLEEIRTMIEPDPDNDAGDKGSASVTTKEA